MRIVLFLLMFLAAAPVFADDWQVNRVRGEVTQQIGGTWRQVSRGEIIPTNRYVRTSENGRVGLIRGRETIELEANTQIRIKDAGADLMTTVLQDFGVVSIEAERRNVQHFSVQTPFLAAVVKGTRFTVRSDNSGATVEVDRGVVQVQDTVNDLVVDVRPGQDATVTKQAPLLVEGRGAVAVFSFSGKPVINGTTTEATAENVEAAAQASKSNNAGGNGNGNAFGLTKDNGNNSANGNSSNAGGNGNGNSGNSNAGGNGNGNSGNSNAGGNGNGNGNSGNSNAGGNGNGNSGNGNGNSGNSNAGGNGNGNSGNSNAGGNGNGNSGNSNAGGNGNSNAGGNGNGNGNSADNDDDDSAKTNNAGGNGKGNANGLNK
ncbi:FecR family protein [Devosia neptuniae]|uniref:FecR family protein n=1 Tax=Devosia TaxID=46913 RepID=UPI0022AFBBC6|nr:FecR family protein [Devosia neptuniae]MCZ4346338.1 FecR family protein [Devosia neptuniae]